MELTWVNRGLVIVEVDGRTLKVEGEALFDHDPDFLIFPQTITKWDDGTLISELERDQLLNQVIAEAAKRAWIFEVESQ